MSSFLPVDRNAFAKDRAADSLSKAIASHVENLPASLKSQFVALNTQKQQLDFLVQTVGAGAAEKEIQAARARAGSNGITMKQKINLLLGKLASGTLAAAAVPGNLSSPVMKAPNAPIAAANSATPLRKSRAEFDLMNPSAQLEFSKRGGVIGNAPIAAANSATYQVKTRGQFEKMNAHEKLEFSKRGGQLIP